ncbi:metallophosphoesterase family protein [Myxococcus sp. RHSTA-1-4]|uniref:purple acid phosphatase family protein n=1 Tax=Myxococcus sp. RHSTA-1-4 TaxID=2874601 RepID=UPI001CBC4772|nr:metallophosphoesterase family protein [Myxococcus sp. RHSTA-1-4]MBZ4420656.1 fibronectin type III domain-containing protein [Myxococcus sp. RHSTA-1-4]
MLSRMARPVLTLVVLLQAAGLVLSAARDGTSLGTWLFVELGWSEAHSLALERTGTFIAVLGCLLAMTLRRPLPRLVAAGVASAWCLALALGEWKVGGAPYTDVALPAHATRIAAPLLLALWDRRAAAVQVLRVSIALTFAIHGLESLALHPRFIDLLLSADHRLFGLGLDERGAEILLRLVGVHDVFLAVLVLIGRDSRRVLGWMALWGAVTALSRVVQGGGGATHHALIRAANAGLPLVLLSLSPRMFMNTPTLRMGGRLARAALPLMLLVLPFVAGAQALSGANPGHLRVIWTEDPAHRATISWSTSAAGSAHEVYLDTTPRAGNLGAYARKVAAKNGSAGGAALHHAVVTDLLPGTTYYFVVVSDGKASPERHFITAPDDDRPFRLLSGGDSRTGLAERKKMNQLMATLVEQDPGIIAFVHGGDYNQAADDWAEWSGWLADHALTFTSTGRVLPIIPARGNHEGDPEMFNAVFNTPGQAAGNYYTTKLGANVGLITLDTNISIGGEQAKWLETQLQAAQSGRWIVPNYHRPAFPAVKTPSEARQFWVPLFEKYNVDLALESDGHVLKRTLPIRNEKHDPTGVVYVGEGGLGVPQRTASSQWYLKAPGMAKSAHHVQVLSFSPDKLVYEARGIAGGLEDTYTLQPKRTGLVVAPPAAAAPAIASVTARSETQVAVTFASDMDSATTGTPAAYAVAASGATAPSVQVRDVTVESARTYVLTTTRLTGGGDYTLTVKDVRTAEGGTLAQPVTASFKVQAAGTSPGTTEPEPTQPGEPTQPEEPTVPETPAQPAPSLPEEQPQVPVVGTDEAQPQAAGCTAAAGGSLMWAGAAAAALLARRRRRSQRSELR